MKKTALVIRTKLRPPFTRMELVVRPRLQERIAQGLRGPLTLITAPAGFGKTTLVASCVSCWGMPLAWLSLDKNDNQVERFLSYLFAALQEVDHTIGNEAAHLVATQQLHLETVLTSLVNDLDTSGREMALVLDDYQFIHSQAVHETVIYLLEHCPKTFHLLIATRSDPSLPLARFRARGLITELRTADLSFTKPETAQFLNDVMGLGLDARSVEELKERTEGWIAGLQMAALSMRDREDIPEFIERFSGTNRYILDYLLEEVLANQPREIQRFLLYSSILERLTAPLCDAIMAEDEGMGRENHDLPTRTESPALDDSASILEYLERANLFLVPLDDERHWYRYHNLFADLLGVQLHKLLGSCGVKRLHQRAASWYEQNDLILEAIHHATLASDDEMVERLITQNYLKMMNRGEMSWVRSWTGSWSKEVIYRRPWLCLYEALNHSWFGQLEEANLLLDEAAKLIQVEGSTPSAQIMLGYHDYVKSRVTAMQGDTRRAIELCLTARAHVPPDRLELQIDFSITLGYEYFLYGDFDNATRILNETIRLGHSARAVNNPVAAYCLLARLRIYQGRLQEANMLLQRAAELIHREGGLYHGAVGLLEVETAALLCEWNDADAALTQVKRGLDNLSWWGKSDDFCLGYITLARSQFARGNRIEAAGAIEKAVQTVQTCGVFSEARNAVENAQVRLWLAQGDMQTVNRWAASQPMPSGSDGPISFENELARMTQARVLIAQNRANQAIGLLSQLDETARSAGRMGRVIQILLLKALALREVGDLEHALSTFTECLTVASPEYYVRVFLDEGQPLQALIAQWLAYASAGPLRDYAIQLLSQFDAEPCMVATAHEKHTPSTDPLSGSGQTLVEPLSPRELEVLHLIALGETNQEIARQLFVARGTVKAHTASIFRKLDVANRTEAVARGRQLGILP